MTIDYAALAERLKEHAALHDSLAAHSDEQRQWADDLRTVVTLLREMAEAKPLFFVHALGQDDEEIIHAVAMNGECPKCEPLFTHPAPQPQPQPIDPHMIAAEDRFPDEPTEAQIEAAADELYARRGMVSNECYAIVAERMLRAALAAKE